MRARVPAVRPARLRHRPGRGQRAASGSVVGRRGQLRHVPRPGCRSARAGRRPARPPWRLGAGQPGQRRVRGARAVERVRARAARRRALARVVGARAGEQPVVLDRGHLARGLRVGPRPPAGRCGLRGRSERSCAALAGGHLRRRAGTDPRWRLVEPRPGRAAPPSPWRRSEPNRALAPSRRRRAERRPSRADRRRVGRRRARTAGAGRGPVRPGHRLPGLIGPAGARVVRRRADRSGRLARARGVASRG